MARILVNRFDDFSGANLERIYAFMDRMHDVATEGHLGEMSDWSSAEFVAWLAEIAFTADETIREIKATDARLRAAMNSTILE